MELKLQQEIKASVQNWVESTAEQVGLKSGFKSWQWRSLCNVKQQWIPHFGSRKSPVPSTRKHQLRELGWSTVILELKNRKKNLELN